MKFGWMLISVAVVLSGCAGASTSDSSNPVQSTEDELSAAKTRKTIDKFVQPLWVDPCGHAALLSASAIPTALRPVFQAERQALRATILADDGFGFQARDIDDDSVYAVYTAKTHHTLAGYAVRVSASNGSAISGSVTGYTTAGAPVLHAHDGGQDDHDADTTTCN